MSSPKTWAGSHSVDIHVKRAAELGNGADLITRQAHHGFAARAAIERDRQLSLGGQCDGGETSPDVGEAVEDIAKLLIEAEALVHRRSQAPTRLLVPQE